MLFTGCPEPAELAEFAAGDLPRAALVRIADHLEGCAACSAALGRFDDRSDSFLSRLRQSAEHEGSTVSYVPPQLLEAARSSRRSFPQNAGPRRLDRFELLQELGTGSLGQVFRARDLELDRIVAIKVLRAGRLASHEEIDRFVREAPSAAQQSEMLDQMHGFYSSKVVDRLQAQKIEVTHDYAERPHTIPLPATLMIDLGKQMSERSSSGMQVRMYSDYPFRSRRDGGAKDDFEREALERLRQNAETLVYRFEEFQGRPCLRYATARLMQEACVRCHNGHNDSTKKDWRVGELSGILEIIRPLDRDVARTHAGLRGTFFLIGAIVGSLSALSVLVLIAGKRSRRSGLAA